VSSAAAARSIRAMSHRTTSSLSRVDLLLAQAERFVNTTGREEALARARQVIAYAELEMSRDPKLREQLVQRCMLAERLIDRLGSSVRDRRGELCVHAEDAAVAESWGL
jgi:hypothetical protein